MKFALLFVSVLSLISEGLYAVGKDSFGRLMFEMEVTSASISDSGTITLLAVGKSDGSPVGLSVEIHGHEDSVRNPLDKQLRMPMYLRSVGETSITLDSIVAQHYQFRDGDTLFKPEGYQGILENPADTFFKKGGRFFIADPRIEGSIGWSIELRWNKSKGELSLFISGQQE